jgi:hypothetical protein
MPKGTRSGERSWTAGFGNVTKPMSGSPWPKTKAMGGNAAVRTGALKVIFAATGKRIRRLPIPTRIPLPIS